MGFNNRKTWLIADTHFDHMKMCEYCGRPEDFNEQIIYHWKRMIKSWDLVYHLGDCYFGKRSKFFDCIQQLPGQKILIKGNHDRENTKWYLDHGFVSVLDFAAVISRTNMRKKGEYFLYTRVLLSHKPMKIPKLGGYKTINIFGHFHGNPPDGCEQKLIKSLTGNHYHFSLEDSGYKPVLLCRSVRDKHLLQYDKKGNRWKRNQNRM